MLTVCLGPEDLTRSEEANARRQCIALAAPTQTRMVSATQTNAFREASNANSNQFCHQLQLLNRVNIIRFLKRL